MSNSTGLIVFAALVLESSARSSPSWSPRAILTRRTSSMRRRYSMHAWRAPRRPVFRLARVCPYEPGRLPKAPLGKSPPHVSSHGPAARRAVEARLVARVPHAADRLCQQPFHWSGPGAEPRRPPQSLEPFAAAAPPAARAGAEVPAAVPLADSASRRGRTSPPFGRAWPPRQVSCPAAPLAAAAGPPHPL